MTDSFKPNDPNPVAPSDETGDATGTQSTPSGGARTEATGTEPGETFAGAGLTPHTQPAEGGRSEAEDEDEDEDQHPGD